MQINQATVFGRVISGLPEASFLWLFFIFHIAFFAHDAFISFMLLCEYYTFMCVFVCASSYEIQSIRENLG